MNKIFLFGLIILTSCQTDCNELTYKDGITSKNGKLFTGNCKSFFSNGQLRSIQNYVEGLDHGKWIFYHPAEIVQTSGEFNMGKRIGTWKYYYNNGLIWKISHYDSLGRRKGKWITYALDETIDTIVTYN